MAASLPRRALAALPLALTALPRAARAAESLAAAIASATRSPWNIARDRYRHPAATLGFFGLRPSQTVLEIEPGAGYWTEILAPCLSPNGRYIAAIPVPPSAGMGRLHPQTGRRSGAYRPGHHHRARPRRARATQFRRPHPVLPQPA